MTKLPSLRSLAAVVTAFLPVCGVLGGCDINSLQNCAHQLSSYERQISAGFISYTESELEDICRRFDDISVCVRRATSTCPSSQGSPSAVGSSVALGGEGGGGAMGSGLDPGSVDGGQFVSTAAHKKKLWSGLEASFKFLCKYGKRTYLRYLQCFSTQPLQSSIRHCNRTYHMEKASAHTVEKTCLITNAFLQCLRVVVKRHCGEEASAWEVTVVQRLREPTMEMFGCALGGRCLNASHFIVITSALISCLGFNGRWPFTVHCL